METYSEKSDFLNDLQKLEFQKPDTDTINFIK